MQGHTTAHHDTQRDNSKAAREPGYAQATGRLCRWWQVLGSNQRRLSRRVAGGSFTPRLLQNRAQQSPVTRLFSFDLSERGYPGPVIKQAGLSIDESGPPPFGLLKVTQPPILVARPPHYVGVNALQETIQSRPVEPSVVVHPAAHDRIDPRGKLVQVRPDSLVYPPVTNLLAFRLEGIRADCRRERREKLPIPVLRAARTELVCQEHERRVLVRTPPVCVPAIHYLGLAGMQPQSQALQPHSEGIANLTRLILRRAMEHRIICVTLEFHGRELSLQP